MLMHKFKCFFSHSSAMRVENVSTVGCPNKIVYTIHGWPKQMVAFFFCLSPNIMRYLKFTSRELLGYFFYLSVRNSFSQRSLNQSQNKVIATAETCSQRNQ